MRARAIIVAVIPLLSGLALYLWCKPGTSLKSPIGSRAIDAEDPIPQGCDIDGPAALEPAIFHRLKLGMPRSEAEALLGTPSYSPSPEQFYHSTGSGCRVETEDRVFEVPCGFIVQYSRPGPTTAHEPSAQRLESCSWGPIAE